MKASMSSVSEEDTKGKRAKYKDTEHDRICWEGSGRKWTTKY